VPTGIRPLYTGNEIFRPVVDYEDPETEIFNTKLTVFGAEYLSNPELKKYFDNKAKGIKWLNDSAAIVEFTSE
jgi:hypothetical protein